MVLEKMMMIEREVDEETVTEARMMMMEEEEKWLGDGSIVCASSEKGEKKLLITVEQVRAVCSGLKNDSLGLF